MSDPKCEICHKEPAFVACSIFGAISHALCQECSVAGRKPWATLVGVLAVCDPSHVAEWVKPIIQTTCEFYKKSEDELWAEVEEFNRGYEKLMMVDNGGEA